VANDITSNPWILDTVTAGLLWPSNVYVDHFEYIGDVAGDTVQISNAAGLVVWEGMMSTDLNPDHSSKIGVVFGGLRVSQISSGIVRVYLGKPS
jgi:hypothetical protein